MKLLIVLTVVTYITSIQALTDEQKAKIAQFHKECIAETGVDPQLILKALKGDVKDDAKLKQFTFCFFKKIGFQNEQGELQEEVIKAKLPHDVNENEAMDVLNACRDTTGTDSADKALNIYKCYWNATPNHISLVS